MQRSASGKNLLFITAASLASVGAVAAVLLRLQNQPAWWEGYQAALAIGAVTAAVSLPPLLIGLRYGMMALVAACFASFVLRTLACVAAVGVAVGMLGYPALPTFILAAVFYLTLLGAETTYLGVTHWSA
jgi:hypothetical protein